jgi:hypothetical protein
MQNVGNFFMLQQILEYSPFFEAGKVQNVLSDGNSNSRTRLSYSQYRITKRMPSDRALTESCVLKIPNGMFVMGKGESGKTLTGQVTCIFIICLGRNSLRFAFPLITYDVPVGICQSICIDL